MTKLRPIGVEKIAAWPSTLALDLVALAEARGADPAHPRDELMVRERSVMPPWEDPVTMAVNAARRVVDDDDRDAIELLLVATETGVDLEKPISSWVHRFCELPSRCRNLEVKHACYGGTGAMTLAASYLSSPFAGVDAKALVVTTDASLIGTDQPWEYVLGAGATALLVSRDPRFLALSPADRGVYASEVTDVIRPTGRLETGNSAASLFAYLEGVDGAFDALEARRGRIDWRRAFDRHVYHAPFPGLTARAHRRVLGRDAELDEAAARGDFERRVLPSLAYGQRTGGTYSGSTFLGLLSMARHGDVTDGTTACVYSFGSGSCAEAYAATFGPDAAAIARAADLDALLDARERIDVATYEALERERAEAYGVPFYVPTRRRYGGEPVLTLREVRDFEREYAWS